MNIVTQIKINEKRLYLYRMHSGFNNFVILDGRFDSSPCFEPISSLLAQNMPKAFRESNLILSDERPECTTSYMRTQIREGSSGQTLNLGTGFLKGKEYKIDKFDQLLYMIQSKIASCRVVIYNADGSLPSMCANGLRCITKLLLDESSATEVKLEVCGKIYTGRAKDDGIALNIGRPSINWKHIPLKKRMKTPVLQYKHEEFTAPIV